MRSLPVSVGIIAIFATTIALVLARPRRVPEGVWTLCGATAMWAIGAVDMKDLRELYDAAHGAILFLVALLVLSALVAKSGLFEWAAAQAARSAGGSGKTLFRNLFLLGAVVTATLSLDTTAVLLTPIVLAIVRKLRVPARPYVIACAFVANAASLSLPISNLTNLILAAAFRIRFATFVAYALPAQIVVLAATFGGLAWYFRRELPAFDEQRAAREGNLVPNRRYLRATVGALGLALVGYLVAPFMGIEPFIVAFGASALLAAIGVRERRVSFAILREISWGIVPFVLGLFIVVQGIDHLGLADAMARALTRVSAGATGRTLAISGISAIASNAINNLPATLVARTVLEQADPHGALVYATLVGTNVGPNMLPFGSLASILVLTIARERGVRVSSWAFVRTGITVTPIACLLGTLVVAAMQR